MVTKKRSKKSSPPNFEAALEELEALVEQMEAGEITLEESLQHFERGILLTRTCQEALKAAEQKVSILLKDNHAADATIQPFDTDRD